MWQQQLLLEGEKSLLWDYEKEWKMLTFKTGVGPIEKKQWRRWKRQRGFILMWKMSMSIWLLLYVGKLNPQTTT